MEKNVKENSYITANVDLPVKLLQDYKVIKSVVQNKHIPLRHFSLCPTNRCNLNCVVCFCKDRDKNEEIGIGEIKNLLNDSYELGCKAIDLTGGGEPLMHPEINEIIKYAHGVEIGVSLVTNGLLLDRLEVGVRWSRISLTSNREFKKLKLVVERAVKKFPRTRQKL